MDKPRSTDRLPDLRAAAADATFRLFRLQTDLYNRFSLPVISTARPFSFYRKAFFDNRSERAVLDELQGKVILDIGCGFTPYMPDSMFQACRRAGIDFYGVDPKLGQKPRFNLIDTVARWSTNLRAPMDPNAPGEAWRIGAMADNLPFADGAVDLILSSWLLEVWLSDPDILASIYREFARVLKPGGQARLMPQPKLTPGTRGRAFDDALQAFDVHQKPLPVGSPNLFPPAYLTILTRRS